VEDTESYKRVYNEYKSPHGVSLWHFIMCTPALKQSEGAILWHSISLELESHLQSVPSVYSPWLYCLMQCLVQKAHQSRFALECFSPRLRFGRFL
jgi:hypothetical protein